jgi:plasmid stabilization system protein ParE
MNIIWTGQARHTYDSTIAYLLEEWTVKAAQNFIDSVDEMEEQLKDFPNSFPISDKKQYLRKAVLGKHNSLVYQIDGDDIVFVTFIGNKQDHEY